MNYNRKCTVHEISTNITKHYFSTGMKIAWSIQHTTLYFYRNLYNKLHCYILID
jgi:hypothetical protein